MADRNSLDPNSAQNQAIFGTKPEAVDNGEYMDVFAGVNHFDTDPALKDQRTPLQELGVGWDRGVFQTKSMIHSGIEAIASALGADDYAAAQKQTAENASNDAAANPASVGSYTDVNSFRDGVMFAAGAIGEQAPQFMPDAAAAIATGGASAIGSGVARGLIKTAAKDVIESALEKEIARKVGQVATAKALKTGAKVGVFESQLVQNTGESRQNQLDEGIDNPLAAIVTGAIKGGIDYAATKYLFDDVVSMMKGGATKLTASKRMAEGLLEMGVQGGAEAAQALTDHLSIAAQKPGYDLNDPRVMEDIINSGIVGGLVGGVPHAVKGVVDSGKYAFNRLTTDQPDAPTNGTDVPPVQDSAQPVDQNQPVDQYGTPDDSNMQGQGWLDLASQFKDDGLPRIKVAEDAQVDANNQGARNIAAHMGISQQISDGFAAGKSTGNVVSDLRTSSPKFNSLSVADQYKVVVGTRSTLGALAPNATPTHEDKTNAENAAAVTRQERANQWRTSDMNTVRSEQPHPAELWQQNLPNMQTNSPSFQMGDMVSAIEQKRQEMFSQPAQQMPGQDGDWKRKPNYQDASVIADSQATAPQEVTLADRVQRIVSPEASNSFVAGRFNDKLQAAQARGDNSIVQPTAPIDKVQRQATPESAANDMFSWMNDRLAALQNQRADAFVANEGKLSEADKEARIQRASTDPTAFLDTPTISSKIDQEEQARAARNAEAFAANNPKMDSAVDEKDAIEHGGNAGSGLTVQSVSNLKRDESDSAVMRAQQSATHFAERSIARSDTMRNRYDAEGLGISDEQYTKLKDAASRDQNSTYIASPARDLFWFKDSKADGAPFPVYMPEAVKEIVRDPSHPANRAKTARDKTVSAMHDFIATMQDNGYVPTDIHGNEVDPYSHYASAPVTINGGNFPSIQSRTVSFDQLLHAPLEHAISKQEEISAAKAAATDAITSGDSQAIKDSGEQLISALERSKVVRDKSKDTGPKGEMPTRRSTLESLMGRTDNETLTNAEDKLVEELRETITYLENTEAPNKQLLDNLKSQLAQTEVRNQMAREGRKSANALLDTLRAERDALAAKKKDLPSELVHEQKQNKDKMNGHVQQRLRQQFKDTLKELNSVVAQITELKKNITTISNEDVHVAHVALAEAKKAVQAVENAVLEQQRENNSDIRTMQKQLNYIESTGEASRTEPAVYRAYIAGARRENREAYNRVLTAAAKVVAADQRLSDASTQETGLGAVQLMLEDALDALKASEQKADDKYSETLAPTNERPADVRDKAGNELGDAMSEYDQFDLTHNDVAEADKANALAATRLADAEMRAALSDFNQEIRRQHEAKVAAHKAANGGRSFMGEAAKKYTLNSPEFQDWLAHNKKRETVQKTKAIIATSEVSDVMGRTVLAHLADVVRKLGVSTTIRIAHGKLAGKRLATVTKDGNGNHVITIDTAKFAALDSDSRLAILAHEIGHVLVSEKISGMDTKVLAVLRDDFRKVAAQLPADHPYNKNGETVGFDEYLADQFAAHLRSRDKATTRSQKAFAEIKSMLVGIVNAVSRFLFGRERLAGTPVGHKFMESVFRAGVNAAAGRDAETTRVGRRDAQADFFDKFVDEAFRSDAMVKRTRAQLGAALGLSNVNSRAQRDFDMRQAAAKAGGIARYLVNAGLHPMETGKRIAKAADDLHHSLPIFIAARTELRDISKRIADRYDKVFDNHIADNDAWQQRVTRLFNGMSDVQKQEMADFIEGRSAVAPQFVRDYLDALYAHVKADIPTLNYLKDHFPRMYNVAAITDNKDAFINLVQTEAQKLGMDVDGEQVYDHIVNGRTLFTNEMPADVKARGSTFQSSKQRILDFVPDQALRQAGFLDNNVEGTLRHYTNKALRNKHFAQQFGQFTDINYKWDWVKDRFPEVAFDEKWFDQHFFSGPDSTPAQDVQAMHNAVNRKILTWMMEKAPLVDANGSPIPPNAKRAAIRQPSGDSEFMRQNMPFINQLAQQNWIKVTRGVANSVSLAFYDQNAKLREEVEILPATQQRRVATIIDAYEGRLAADKLSPKARNFMSNIAAYQNVLLMAFSSFTSLADAAGLVFKGADLASASKNLKEIGSIISNMRGSERLKLYKDLGYAEHRLASQAFLDSYGIQYQSPTAQKVNNMLFTLNGQIGMTNAMRIMAAALGERHIADIPADLKSGDPIKAGRAADMLKDLGITEQDAAMLSDPNFKHYNEYVDAGDTTSPEAQQAFRIHSAMNKYVSESITRPDARMRPVWGSDPRFMLIFQYKAFMFAYWEGIMKPLFAQAVRNMQRAGDMMGKIGQGAQAAAVFAVPVLALSAVGLWLRQYLQYEMWGQARPTDSMSLPQYTYEVIKRGGILGPLEMGTSYIQDATNGKANAVSLLGPTASHIDTLMSLDPQRIVNRSVPLISQIPALRDYTKSMFN